MKHILKCNKCFKYTMKKECECGGKVLNVQPAKFSLQDTYGKYRRKVKEEVLKKEGLL